MGITLKLKGGKFIIRITVEFFVDLKKDLVLPIRRYRYSNENENMYLHIIFSSVGEIRIILIRIPFPLFESAPDFHVSF